MEPPSTPRPKQLTRDQRLRILVLSGEGYSYNNIASRVG